jgi:hypothetical protein
MPPNGSELSCPAARATVGPFSRILAGKSRSNFPPASRVSCSELLCVRERQAGRRSATVPHSHTPGAASAARRRLTSPARPLGHPPRLATAASLRRRKTRELDLAGYASPNPPMPRLAGTLSPQSLAPAPVPRRDTRCSSFQIDRQGLFASPIAGEADQHRPRWGTAEQDPRQQ